MLQKECVIIGNAVGSLKNCWHGSVLGLVMCSVVSLCTWCEVLMVWIQALVAPGFSRVLGVSHSVYYILCYMNYSWCKGCNWKADPSLVQMTHVQVQYCDTNVKRLVACASPVSPWSYD